MKRMEHLTCFVAGNLALGVANGAVSGEKAEQYLGAAKNITRTCFEMYNKMPTGKHIRRVASVMSCFSSCQARRATFAAPARLLDLQRRHC